MKKVIRTIAVVLCAVMALSCFTGCTISINVNLDQANIPNDSVAVNNTVAASTTAAPQPVSETSAPASETTAAPTETSASTEPATDAPAADKAPSTTEEIVAEYAKVYNTTKATGTFVGHDAMECPSIILDGKDNSMLKGIAGQFITANGTNQQLPPYSDDNPAKECLITAADVQEATYRDNGDGTATIKIVIKETKNSKKFQDSNGKMFNVMEDLAGTLAGIPVLTWSEGDANSNVTLTNKDSYAEVTYNKETKMMTKADYVLTTVADVVHANVAIFRDKSAQATFVYTMTYPG